MIRLQPSAQVASVCVLIRMMTLGTQLHLVPPRVSRSSYVVRNISASARPSMISEGALCTIDAAVVPTLHGQRCIVHSFDHKKKQWRIRLQESGDEMLTSESLLRLVKPAQRGEQSSNDVGADRRDSDGWCTAASAAHCSRWRRMLHHLLPCLSSSAASVTRGHGWTICLS